MTAAEQRHMKKQTELIKNLQEQIQKLEAELRVYKRNQPKSTRIGI